MKYILPSILVSLSLWVLLIYLLKAVVALY